MIIAVPTENTEGKTARICAHYGRAPYFAFINTESQEIDFLDKLAHSRKHGEGCTPMGELNLRKVSRVICKGLGQGAHQKLTSEGIQVDCLQESIRTLEELLQSYENDPSIFQESPALCDHQHDGHDHHEEGHSCH